MRKWALVLISITLCIVLGNNVYATEDVEIYQEPQIQHKGRIVINFYSTDSKERQVNNLPVEGVQIELYYRYQKVMHNVKELDLFKYTNLTLKSDENGKIILSNLPYGVYQYKVVSVPTGFKYDTELKIIDLNLMNETSTEEVYLLKEIIMAEGSTMEEEKEEVKEEEKEENKDEVEENEKGEEDSQPTLNEKVESDEEIENIVISGPKDEEAINKNINNLVSNMYISTETEESITEEDKQVMVHISKELNKKAKAKKVDRIEKMKTIRITETLKISIVTMDDTMYYLKALSERQENDIEKTKDKRRKVLDKINEKKYKNVKVTTYSRIHTDTNTKG